MKQDFRGGIGSQVEVRNPPILLSSTVSNPDDIDRVYYSNLYLGQTIGDFRASVNKAIDQVTQEHNGYKEKLERRRKAYSEAGKTMPLQERDDLREDYLEYSIPTYVQLRMMGYAHYDLWV